MFAAFQNTDRLLSKVTPRFHCIWNYVTTKDYWESGRLNLISLLRGIHEEFSLRWVHPKTIQSWARHKLCQGWRRARRDCRKTGWVKMKCKFACRQHLKPFLFFFDKRMLAQSYLPNIHIPRAIPLLYNPFTIVRHKRLSAYMIRSSHSPACCLACKTVAAAIVGSRLDYCNSLLAGTSVSNLARLQLVQNTLAWVVAQKSRFCRITPILADLHRLPVRHRINYKIATIAFGVLHFQQPSYLAAIVPRYVPCDHWDLPLPCQYPFPRRKLQWQGPSLSNPLPRTLGISYHVIFRPFPLFLLSGRDSSIIFFRVPSPVFPLHPLTSRFVMSSHPRM